MNVADSNLFCWNVSKLYNIGFIRFCFDISATLYHSLACVRVQTFNFVLLTYTCEKLAFLTRFHKHFYRN